MIYDVLSCIALYIYWYPFVFLLFSMPRKYAPHSDSVYNCSGHFHEYTYHHKRRRTEETRHKRGMLELSTNVLKANEVGA